MQGVSVLLYLVASVGLAALALKYLFGPAPTAYHAEILKRAGVATNPAVTRVTAALNQVLGASFLAFAVLVAVVAVFGVGSGLFWANAGILVSVLIVGGIATRVTYETEKATGVRTPWRQGAGLTGLSVLAFILDAL